MLFDSARHERLLAVPWDEARARDAIERVVRDTEARFSPVDYWPLHPLDADGRRPVPAYPLYHGACGVIWALHYLEALGAAQPKRSFADDVRPLLGLTRRWLRSLGSRDDGSYLMGETGIRLLIQRLQPDAENGAHLEELIRGNLHHPARELMWGAPGTLLAALFLHGHTGEERWAVLFRETSRTLRKQLLWSDEYRCHYWAQDLYGEPSTYLDAVHGFVATALPLIRGRGLLEESEWQAWERAICDTVARTAVREGGLANWRAWLYPPAGAPSHLLMQYCHGAPGFVVCLGGMPGAELDELLLAAGEATWAAGPLAKGSNLCHGTGGNGYAFLKLFARTQDELWLDRARAFAMHGIAQTEAHAERYGRMRYSLWTGDPGFAIYLWDCIRGRAAFPSLDVFFTT